MNPAEAGASRAEADFTALFDAAYTGRHDPPDALFWHEHPLSVAPSGLPDPALRLMNLNRAVFSRSAQPDPLAPVELRRLTAELADDRMALERALAAARAAPDDADTEADGDIGTVAKAGPRSGSDQPAQPAGNEPIELRDPSTTRPLTAGVVAVAGVLVALAIGRFAVTPPPEQSALAVFDRPAVAEDSLPGSSRFITLSGSEVAESRYLGTTSVWDIWGVRTVDGQVCVLAGVADIPLSACTTAAIFTQSGVTLRLPADSMGRPLSVTWGPLEPQAVTPANGSG